jgi:acetylornithine deacetylase/succinyl-diaminopimelate desuccinylase-like protein
MAAGTAQARLAVNGVARHAGAAPGQRCHVLVELPGQLLQTQDVVKGMALAIKAQAIHAGLDGRQLLLHASSGGGSDGGYAGRSGKAAVLDSLGLAGWGHHAKNEYIEIDSVSPRLYLTRPLPGDLGAGR